MARTGARNGGGTGVDAAGSDKAVPSAEKDHKKAKGAAWEAGGKEKKAYAKPGALVKHVHRTAEREERRARNPAAPVDRSGGEAAPRVVAVVGPRRSGKSTIIRSLVKHYTRRKIGDISAPLTLVSGRQRRLTLLEVSDDLPSLIDAVKVADLLLCTVDAHQGLEMETFELLNIALTHGMPRVMGVLTHLDAFRDGKALKAVKKRIKSRFWAELYDGAKLFYFSGVTASGEYLRREVLNLGRFISVVKYRPLRWRSEHSYVLADRVEDVTPGGDAAGGDRVVAAFGYVRGTHLRAHGGGGWRVHVAGVGDLSARRVDVLADPCPPPDGGYEHADAPRKRRRLDDRQRALYAPMLHELDGVSYDRDAVYITLPDERVMYSGADGGGSGGGGDSDASVEEGEELARDGGDEGGEGARMVRSLQGASRTMDAGAQRRTLRLLAGGRKMVDEPVKGVDDADKDPSSEASDDSGGDGEGLTMSSEEKGESGNDDADSEEDGGDFLDDEGGNGEADGAELLGEERAELRWKALRAERGKATAASAQMSSAALTKYIYGDGDGDGESEMATEASKRGGKEGVSRDDDGDGDDSDDEIFFRLRRRGRAEGGADGGGDGRDSGDNDACNDDRSRLCWANVQWSADEDACRWLRLRRFATGAAAAAARSSAGGDDADDDADSDAAYGDFEDLETGETYAADGRSSANSGSGSDDEVDMEELQRRRVETKRRFDERYEGGERGRRPEAPGGGDVDDDDDYEGGAHPAGRISEGQSLAHDDARARATMEAEREQLELVRRSELSSLDEQSRLDLEGIAPGRYVRVELVGVPVELVRHFNPRFPVLLGGLRAEDERCTFLRARVKRHRWRRGALKSMDPLIVSVGWRRYQTLPVYSVEDQQKRQRFLKYTPEHMHCQVTFWGFAAAPGSGVVMCQSLGRERRGFRVSALGALTELDARATVVKKLKLVGAPYRVRKNTAFVRNMFHSELEVAKFVGAQIRTVSGIRGTVKKALRAGESAAGGGAATMRGGNPPGSFRATFEDKVLASDLVFLRAWVPVPLRRFCSVATTLLEENGGGGESTWRLRTARELREARGVPIPRRSDSLYRPIERSPRKFNPLRIPRRLEAALPYASRPKQLPKKRRRTGGGDAAERAVVMEPDERREYTLLQMVSTLRNDRERKRRAAAEQSLRRKKEQWQAEEAVRQQADGRRRKARYIIQGLRDGDARAKR